MSDDLREQLERLANRVEDGAEPFAGLERARARRARTRRLTAVTLALVVGVAGTLVVVGAFDDVGFAPLRDLPAPVSPEPEPTKTHTDRLGWSIDYPADWSVLPIDGRGGGFSTIGAAFSNGPLFPLDTGSEASVWPDPSKLSPHQVVVMVIRERFPPPRFANDSSFPLRPVSAAILNAQAPFERHLSFRGDGLRFGVWWGAVDGKEAKRDVMEQMIRSIRFGSWRTGEESNGFVSVGPRDAYPQDSAVPVSAGRLGVVYVFFGKGNTYALDLEPDSCGEGENRKWDAAQQEVLIECPDGTEVRYHPSGFAPAGNPDGFGRNLAAHPLIVSWDGHLLVALGVRQQ